MATKCLACQGEIVGGQFVNIPAGAIHPECFLCPCCGKSLLNAKGYLPYKVRRRPRRGSTRWRTLTQACPEPRATSPSGTQGNFVCSVGCRTLAVRDPSLLLQTSKHWRQVQSGGKTEWEAAGSGK